MAFSSTLVLLSGDFTSSLTYKSVSHPLGSRVVPKLLQLRFTVKCNSNCNDSEPIAARQSKKYPDSDWEYDYIQSFMRSDYSNVKYKTEADELKHRVRDMMRCTPDYRDQLELINDLQRLGVAYHFENEISSILKRIYHSNSIRTEYSAGADLYVTALMFRLLRQHGFPVPQDIFKCFLDDTGKFKLIHVADIKGLVSLYEASHLSTEYEGILDEALTFSTLHLNKLNKFIESKRKKLTKVDPYLEVLLVHGLGSPLHWRTARTEARWYIEEAYERKPNMSPLVHLFAKLDFNILQGIYQDEIRELSRWWKKLGLMSRGSVVRHYFKSTMISFQPKYKAWRRAFTQTIALVSVINEVYYVYGTSEEVELFTDTVLRWDIDSMKQLPQYMKIYYLACYNTINEIAYEVLIDKRLDVIFSLKNEWAKFARSYLEEARWFHNGHRPALDEYLNSARISTAMSLVTMHAHVIDTRSLEESELKYLESDPDILKWACTTLRLSDDLRTSTDEMARGDNPKAIQCYMNDTGASEQAARSHVEKLVRRGWKKLNKYKMEESILSAAGTERLLNMVRASHCFHQHGDGHGSPVGEFKRLMSKILFDPIPL